MTKTTKNIAAKTLVSGALALAALGLASGTAHAFDPQPEPPTRITTQQDGQSGPIVNRGGLPGSQNQSGPIVN